ncbi:7960_t:CDS:2 [Cetraspora pellucida]|uniref:7960_t:CDS:1 n=1 Tax=Cetraspora pellucida TaxID=1433469 RepID=A0A9N9FK65_9GLOM|nr:7960_t:CDS:2 [Cetraspora pellucida]
MQKTKYKNAAKNHIRTQSRDSSGKFSKPAGTESSDSEYSDLEYSDPELLVYESENNNEKYFNNEETELDDEEAKHSKHTQQCKNKGLWEAAQGSMSLDNFFKPQINKLKNKLKDVKNMNAYEYLHFLAVHKYLTAIFNHEESHSRIKLSLEISQQVFQRETLSVSKQEQQKYISTLIDDEDVQSSCLRFICTIGERLTADKFQNYVQNNILPNVTSSHTSISLETARIWLHRLGIYYDGYECLDVVQYHAVFLEKMKDLEALMLQFVDDNMETVINSEISEEKQVYILVTHDECIFYTNDGRPSVWASLGMLPLRKKEKGKALMVSEFLTETHGHLTITPAEINELNLSPTFPQEAHVIVKSGKNDDGWWNAFDITNHSALASDTLCAKNMNLFPSSKQSRLHDSWFINEQGKQVTQPMIFSNDLPLDNDNYIFCDQSKGIQQVLRKHKLWPSSGLKLKCNKNYCDPSVLNCYACHLLSAQSDFTMQKSALEELIVEREHICVFYLKFHCELNFIERYWGAIKRYAREHCDYSWARL